MNRITTTAATGALALFLSAAPFVASAATLGAQGDVGIVMSPSGMVRVIGADVTSVAGSVVDATLSLGGNILNFVVNASATTKVGANGSKTASTTAIAVGDKVNIAGSLSSSAGNTLTIAAKHIRDLTTLPPLRVFIGTISSVNASNDSFVASNKNKTVTVDSNASTTFKVNGTASAFSELAAGQRVVVSGSANADGSVITASKVNAGTPAVKTTTNGDEQSKDDLGIHAGDVLGLHFGNNK